MKVGRYRIHFFSPVSLWIYWSPGGPVFTDEERSRRSYSVELRVTPSVLWGVETEDTSYLRYWRIGPFEIVRLKKRCS